MLFGFTNLIMWWYVHNNYDQWDIRMKLPTIAVVFSLIGLCNYLGRRARNTALLAIPYFLIIVLACIYMSWDWAQSNTMNDVFNNLSLFIVGFIAMLLLGFPIVRLVDRFGPFPMTGLAFTYMIVAAIRANYFEDAWFHKVLYVYSRLSVEDAVHYYYFLIPGAILYSVVQSAANSRVKRRVLKPKVPKVTTISHVKEKG